MPILFVAIALPPETMSQLAGVTKHLAERVAASDANSDLKLAWTPPEKFHLTLQYLGGIAEERILAVHEAAAEAALHAGALEIEWGDWGVFPARGDARTVWLGVRDREKQLQELASSVSQALAARGFSLDGRMFVPHLTLARIRSGRFPREVLSQHLDSFHAAFTATELTVVESQRLRSGSTYRALSKHRFQRMA